MVASPLTLRDVLVRPVTVPMARPIRTAVGVIPAAPLVLVDVLTEEGVTGRAYAFAYTPVALAPLARSLGYDVTVVDPRTAFASPERFPDVPLVAEWPDVALPPLNIDRYTAFVALTHDPKIDDPALLHAFERDCFYIGALGSKKTHGRRVERLKEQGASESDVARIHAPIGLAIGAVSPAEIAVSIMAEITATLRLLATSKAAAA